MRFIYALRKPLAVMLGLNFLPIYRGRGNCK